MRAIYAVVDLEKRSKHRAHANSKMYRLYYGQMIKIIITDGEARWFYETGMFYEIPFDSFTEVTIKENPEYFL